MTKEKKPTEDKPRPYGQGKRPKNLRFTPETLRKLAAAASREGVSETVYVELALKDRFRKDGLT
jgi:predicted HicB family RNase H-like nuclease